MIFSLYETPENRIKKKYNNARKLRNTVYFLWDSIKISVELGLTSKKHQQTPLCLADAVVVAAVETVAVMTADAIAVAADGALFGIDYFLMYLNSPSSPLHPLRPNNR